MVRTLDRVGNFLLRWKISKKALAIIFVVLFVLSLVPIVVTAFYSVPVLDDYTFGLRAHLAYAHGDSFLSGALESCDYFYNNWQGVYTANFIASIQPFVFNENLYWISNITVLFAVCFSLFFFIKVIVINVLQADKWDYLLISIPIVTLFLQFMPGIQEGIYWMDGSLSLLVNSVYLIVFSLVILYHFSKKKKNKIIYSVLAVLLVLLFSGSSYLCYVTCLILTISSVIYCICKKHKTYKLILLLFGIYTVGVVVSVLAPGNAVRMSSVSGLSLPMSIMKALIMSVFYFGEWSSLFYIATLVFISVVFYSITKRTKYQFKYPLLVFVLCYIVYAGRMSVQYYATGTIGGWRQLNQYYLGFLLCITISFLYFVGWLSKKELIDGKVLKYNRKAVSVVLVMIIAFAFISGTVCYAYNHVVSSISTSISLVKGETKQYHSEMMRRIEKYNDPDLEGVEVSPLSVYPKFFVPEPLSEDYKYWTNESNAKYYEKQYITLLHE